MGVQVGPARPTAALAISPALLQHHEPEPTPHYREASALHTDSPERLAFHKRLSRCMRGSKPDRLLSDLRPTSRRSL